MDDFFSNKMHQIEHAISLYATSYVTIPAFAIYDDQVDGAFGALLDKCHIYLIGLLPSVELVNMEQTDDFFKVHFLVENEPAVLDLKMPDQSVLVTADDGSWLIRLPNGKLFAPPMEELLWGLSEKGLIGFEVLYIGQAYGREGNRRALDRLKAHSTLQKISLKGIPEDKRLSILMLEIAQNNQIITMINPSAQLDEQSDVRIKAGIDKLFEANEPEQITLFEAGLIRYFRPEFNIEFKESFPSTRMKVLNDCYDKDFSALVVEVCIERLPFQLFSKSRKQARFHIAKHDLHTDERRRAFWSHEHGEDSSI